MIIPLFGLAISILHLVNFTKLNLYNYLKALVLKNETHKLDLQIDEVRDSFLDEYEIYHPAMR